MEIVNAWPPLIDEIDKVFHVKHRKDVIFAWEDRIYAPHGQQVPFHLRAHELVHMDRQRRHPEGVIGWWRDYMEQPEFRLFEEIPAHYAEYRYLIANTNRHGRRAALIEVARKLSSPLYGNMISFDVAKRVLDMGPAGAQDAKRAIPEDVERAASGEMATLAADEG